MDEISLDYPQVTAYPLDSLTYKVDPGRTGEGVYMANLDIREEFFTLEPERRRAEGPFYLYNQRAWPTHRAYSVDDGSLPRLLVYQDSFGLELIPFLSEHFSSSLFIWTSKIETAFIDMQNPDIVVIECTERELTRLMNITTTEE
jgi:hypothetical protein